ncbi:MAG: ribonuclease PH [candidate division WOR-3 bacterium]
MLREKKEKSKIRSVNIKVNYLNLVPTSVLIEEGNTIVLVSSTITDTVPPFLKGLGEGWITAQYGMLPKSTSSRVNRERQGLSGRIYEIQRLIGRSLRQAFDLSLLGEKTIIVDCDVIQADGGTRAASITGGMVSLYELFREMVVMKEIEKIPLVRWIAAISVGIVDGEIFVDLNFEEDSNAEVDATLVMDEEENLIEVQASGEKRPFTEDELKEMIKIGREGIKELIAKQKEALGIR